MIESVCKKCGHLIYSTEAIETCRSCKDKEIAREKAMLGIETGRKVLTEMNQQRHGLARQPFKCKECGAIVTRNGRRKHYLYVHGPKDYESYFEPVVEK